MGQAAAARARMKARVAGASAPGIAAKGGRSPASSASSMPSEAASSTSYQPGTSTTGKPDLARAFEREPINVARAPGDVREQPGMRFRQPDQGVAAVVSGAQDDIVAAAHRFGGVAQDRARQRRRIRIDQNGAAMSGREKIDRAVQKALAEIALDLRHQLKCLRQQREQGRFGAARRIERVAGDAAVPARAAIVRAKIADEAGGNRRAFVGPQRRRQPRLRCAAHRRLAGDGKCDRAQMRRPLIGRLTACPIRREMAIFTTRQSNESSIKSEPSRAMPSILHVFLCFAAALLFWGTVGLALSRRLMPAALALPVAPALGWAVHSALALPLYRLIGFTPLDALCSFPCSFLAVALLALRLPRPGQRRDRRPRSALGLCAGGFARRRSGRRGVSEILWRRRRLGRTDLRSLQSRDHRRNDAARPAAGQSVFRRGRARSHGLAYYYLWHFSAAELALIPGVSGWEADIALSAFTAFSSVALMMGFAVWIGGRAAAGVWVVPLAFAASLHPVAGGGIRRGEFLHDHSCRRPDLPAGCSRPAGRRSTSLRRHASCCRACCCCSLRAAHRCRRCCSRLVVVAGYESSTWVGGIVFAVAAPAMAVVLLMHMPAQTRRRFVGALPVAALIAAVLAYPFLHDQFLNAAGRDVGSPIAFAPFSVLDFPDSDAVRRALDIPAFWLALLVIEFPAIYIPGLVSLVGTLRGKFTAEPALLMSKLLLVLALVGLAHRRLFHHHLYRQQRSRLARGAARRLCADHLCRHRPRPLACAPSPLAAGLGLALSAACAAALVPARRRKAGAAHSPPARPLPQHRSCGRRCAATPAPPNASLTIRSSWPR